jgi:hypothetical protein
MAVCKHNYKNKKVLEVKLGLFEGELEKDEFCQD